MFRRLEQMQADAQNMLDRYQRLSEEMGSEHVEVYSEDGLIRVRLDSGGKVAEISIDERAMRMRQTLGPTILAVIKEAKAQHGVKMTEMAQALVGDKMDVMGVVRDSLPEHMRDEFDRRRGR
jgi:DNA-binding protein YbaB